MRPHAQATKSSVRLNCETLEDRVTPAVAWALSGTNLLAFDTANPTITQTTAITNLTAGEALVGIDFRPQNGLLYGLGVNAVADTATLYAISTRTGFAGVVGTASGIVFTTDGTTPVDLPDSAMVGYGFDFNPAADRVRVVAGSLNFRVNPNTGLGVDGDNTGLTSGTVTGTNPDGSINGGASTANGSAYTNNQQTTVATPFTTLYTLDAVNNSLHIQNPPNAGTEVLGQVVTLNSGQLDFGSVSGFDIPAGVNVSANNTAVTSGSAFAVLNVGSNTGLYSINLVNGQATFIGNVGNGTTAVQGFAVQSDVGGEAAIGLGTAGGTLVRFNTAAAGDAASVSVTGLVAGETLVGIDFRPQTGQLYGLGVNALGDFATLYLIDPQTGAATIIGAPSGVAFTTDGTTPVDLPTGGYGFDFNPTVDRIRVTTGTGLNFRVNPNNGAAVDGDNGGAGGSVAGTNPDGAINGQALGVSAAAYTNSFGQSLTGGATTLYTLDAATDGLYIQNPANAGTQTNQLALTPDGNLINFIDFTDVTGFDIPAGVRVTSSGAVASGFGYASLVVGNVTNLYKINLTTGVTALIRPAATGLSGLALGDSPAGTVAFTTEMFSAVEGTTAVITLTRTGGLNGTVSVTVSITGGTGVAADIGLAGPYTVTFADGVATATLDIPILTDSLTEGDETLVFTLSAPTNLAVLGAQATTTLTITDVPPPSPPPPPPPAVVETTNPVAVGPVVTVTLGGVTQAITPFSGFNGVVTTATGDVNNDGVADVVTGAGINGHVKVFNGVTGAEISSFLAFTNFGGGIYVGSGDINGDGQADIITGASVNGHVKVFDGATGAEIRSFLAYQGFPGEVRVAGGDIDGDGRDDIITGASVNGHVKVFSGVTGAEIRSFFTYTGFNGGISVAAGDVNGDGRADIVTGSDAFGHVKVFSGLDNSEHRSFFAFPGSLAPTRVASRLVNTDVFADIIVGGGVGAAARVRTFDGLTLATLSDVAASDPFSLGVFVG